MTFEVEAPGCCPICGKGKLILEYFRATSRIHYPPQTWAALSCKTCGAAVTVTAQTYQSALTDAWQQAYRDTIQRDRAAVGGFQFTD